MQKLIDIKCEPNTTTTSSPKKQEAPPKTKPESLIPVRDKSKNEKVSNSNISSSRDKQQSEVDFSKKKIANKRSEESAKLLRPQKEKRQARDPHMRLNERYKGLYCKEGKREQHLILQ